MNGEPRLDTGAAVPGNSAFRFALTNAAPNALAQVFLSAKSKLDGCGLLLDFSTLLFPAPGAALAFTDANGSLTMSLPIPASVPPGPYYAQAFVVDMSGGLTVSGLSFSATGGRAFRVY